MISQIFKFGGGAGIGSYVIVMRDGTLENPNAEKIRLSYDNGDNLYLSILDDVTEEALLPLTGYVDNENVLHLSGRDFDDNKTYEFSIGGENHEIDSDIIDGITLGNGTVPTEGGGSSVSGTNDGTNWTSLTINGDTYGIPQGGSSAPYEANLIMGEHGAYMTQEDLDYIHANQPGVVIVHQEQDGHDVAQTYALVGYMTIDGSAYGRMTYQLVGENRDAFLVGLPTNASDPVATMAFTYATTSQLSAKQDVLVSGNNIKTINNASILGSGNLETATIKSVTPTSINISMDPFTITMALSQADCADIFNNRYDFITLLTEDQLSINITCARQADSSSVIGYVTQIDTGTEVYYYSFALSSVAVYDNTTKRIDGGEELTYATDEEIAALFSQPEPTMWNVTYDLTGCWPGSGAEQQVQDGGLLQFQLNSNFSDYEWQSVTITMGGTDITSAAWDEGNREVLIRNVSGNVVVTAVCIEVEPVPQMATITCTLIACHFEINGETISSGHQVPIGQPLDIAVVGDYTTEYEWSCMTLTMNGVDISSSFDSDGNPASIEIASVTGDIYAEIECIEPEEPEPDEWAIIYEDMNASFSSQPDSVLDGDPLNITISPGSDPWINRDCTVEMGGVDITAEVVTESGNNYIISIPSVDADVTIYVQYEDEIDPGYDWEISYNGNCEATDTSSGEDAPAGVYDYESLDVTLSPDDPVPVVDMMASSIFVTMGGVTIDSDPTKCTIYENGDTYRLVIPQVNGDVVISVNFAYEYPEDEVPIESIRYTDGQGNTCIGFNMEEGTSCDLWDNLEILPADYTDGVDFSSSDDQAVEVDGGGMVTAVGAAGDSATITIRSMEDSSIYTTVSISISEPEEPDEPDEPEEEEE